MKKKSIFLALMILMLIIASCEKPEGVGGESVISGKVTMEVYDKEYTTLQASYPAADEDVFIVYGSNDVYSDDVSTSSNGKFEFNYLTEGEYTIIVYSEDSSRNKLEDITITKKVKLSSDKTNSDIGEIKIFKSVDYDDGNATIKGIVLMDVFNKDITTQYYAINIPAQETDVYLIHKKSGHLIERTRTLSDGSFSFYDLIIGDYQVVVYSDPKPKTQFELIPVINEVSILDVNQTVDLNTIKIELKD